MPNHYNDSQGLTPEEIFNAENEEEQGFQIQTIAEEGNTDSLVIDSLTSKVIDKSFGRGSDYIELHIYNVNDELIQSENNFTEYTIVLDNSDGSQSNLNPPGSGMTSTIEINPVQVLRNRGFSAGKFKLKLNILRNKIFNSDQAPFTIKEISSNRKEIRATSIHTINSTFDNAIGTFISELESAVYFKEFSLNFGNDILLPSINILLNSRPQKHEVLLKTLNVLPNNVRTTLSFKVVEEIVDPFILDVDLGETQLVDNTIDLRGPNFYIDIRQNNSIPSGFKSYDDILSYNITSSYQHLLSKLEDSTIDLNIEYDYVRPVSESSEEQTYHFENFTHFSSAVERLKNFRYKLKLIEKYDANISEINKITGPTSSSIHTLNNKKDINKKKENLIQGFDGYEQFLYFTSGAYAWPKQNTLKPYILYSVTSSEAKTWIGNESSIANSSFYGGQLLSASLFDRQNEYNLNKLIPSHIADNENNALYVNFVDMVGQHFDHMWTYMKKITEVHNSGNNKGISKDLVYYQLKALGIETFDQFENANLIEYLLGMGSGSSTYDPEFVYGPQHYASGSNILGYTKASETIVTASNESIPKEDITKEVWKRLYHNAAYLLKTKGTKRGIRALMSCYGVPSTILNIKEYGGSTPVVGGPLKDINLADYYKTFKYQKSGMAIKGTTLGQTNKYFIETPWSSSAVYELSSSAKTIEFRIKPVREGTAADSNQLLMAMSGSIPLLKDNSLALVLIPYSGVDISTVDDYKNHGRIDLYSGSNLAASTANMPIFDGDFWNIFIGTDGTSGSNSTTTFGAYKANFLGNIHYYTASVAQTEVSRTYSWGDPYLNPGHITNISKGVHNIFFGGFNAGVDSPYNTYATLGYSGSLQEIKYHFHQSQSYEMLSHITLKKHALEPFMYGGNHPSSSFKEVVLRLPLGSNDHKDSSSFHPNIDVDYLGGGTSSMTSFTWDEVIEDHHLPTPDTIGPSWTSEKVRIDQGTIEDNILSPFNKLETSVLDRQAPDYPDLGIFFSPTHELDEDIIYTLGSFRMDDYIGDPLPSAQSSSNYNDLKTLQKFYFQKVKTKYNVWDYMKQIRNIDHTLFKMIEQFVPFKAKLKDGLLIEPNILERNKIPRKGFPKRSDGQTLITGSHQTFEFQITTDLVDNKLVQIASSSNPNTAAGQYEPGSYVIYHDAITKSTSSKGLREKEENNATIHIYDDYVDPFKGDPHKENNHACQAPIKPYNSNPQGVGSAEIGSTFVIEGYQITDTNQVPKTHIPRASSILLGNVQNGRKSNKYYKYTRYYLRTSSLY
jgi:hypothetical protein